VPEEILEQQEQTPQQSPEKAIEVKICPTHSKELWQSHDGYIQNADGSVSCIYCGWGCLIPGYMRVFENKIVDLRTYKAEAN
jgi:hypothetical protein